MPLLDIQNLKFAYPHAAKAAVDLGAWALEAGEIRVIKGPSGCGKTTLLQLISGLRKPNEGSVLFEGADISKMSERERDTLRAQKIGVVFQDFSLIPGFSVGVNLEIAARVSGAAKKQDIRETLDTLGLADKIDDSVAELSRGERQRVAIARALINQPSLLLADEPTASLDDERAHAVMELFLDAQKNHGTSILIATHDARVEQHIDGRIEYWETLTGGQG
ncbi:MAG: ABC transporter ATP-binding protein [Opitutales bacterium]